MRIRSLVSCHQKLSHGSLFKRQLSVTSHHYNPGFKLPEPLSQRALGQASYVKNFRCDETNPAKHRLTDIGMFYKLPEDVLNRTTHQNWDTFTVSKQFARHAKAFNEHCHMIRKPGLELVHYLKNSDYTLPVNRYLLHGPSGSGKSMMLHYAIHYALSNGWLVFPCLNTWDWTHFHHTSKEDQRQEVIKSQYEEDRYDQPEKAANWLATFNLMNDTELLSGIRTRKSYVWSRRDETPAGSTFQQLVEVGIARMRYAPDVIGALVRELIEQNSEEGKGDFPKTLIAVDGVGALFQPLPLLKMMFGVVPEPHELSYFHHIRKAMLNNWTNGAVVTAINEFGGRNPVDSDEHPYDSLTQVGFDCLDPHIPIEVPKYTEGEVLSHLAYYIDRKWLNDKSLVQAAEAELIQVSDHNPRDLVKLCAHLP